MWRGRNTGGNGEAPQSQPVFILPFAPKDISEWTDFHYRFYDLVELAVGNKRTLTTEEIEQNEVLDDVEAAMMNGEENWASKLDDYFGTPNFDNISESEGFLEELDKELEDRYED